MTAAVETGLVWRAPLAFVLLVPLVLAAWARVRARAASRRSSPTPTNPLKGLRR